MVVGIATRLSKETIAGIRIGIRVGASQQSTLKSFVSSTRKTAFLHRKSAAIHSNGARRSGTIKAFGTNLTMPVAAYDDNNVSADLAHFFY